VTLTDRDKKIVLIIIPLVLLVGYWFLLLAPQRQEAQQASDELAKQEERRDKAEARVQELTRAKSEYGAEYGQLIKVGKAVPTRVDLPSLIVQLESAARGTDIDVTKIAAGKREGAAAAASSTSSNGGQAASGPGQAAQTAQGAKSNADSANAGRESAAQKTGVDATTSTSSKSGGLPVGGGATAGGGASAAGGCAAGLECVPLDFEFRGNFFDLADFFHRMKRFVKVANDRLVVRGRLMTIDGLKFSSDDELFPALKAEVTATVYLSPKAEPATAGAAPQGPSGTTAAGSTGESSSPSTPTPTATATP
jgi:hypothetical protein